MGKMFTKPLILVGGGGHALVLNEVLQLHRADVIGYVDPSPSSKIDLKYLGDDEALKNFKPQDIDLVIGIGSTSVESKRKEIYQSFRNKNYYFPSIVHPSAVVSVSAEIGDGVQIMAGAIIQAKATIAENTIINTGAQIDHECKIGANCHLAPGVILSGNVKLEQEVHIGTGAKVIESVYIGQKSMVAAGAVVTNNIPSSCRVQGVPAKRFF